MKNNRIKQIISGTEHETLEDAIAADLVSAIPLFGAASDFMRLLDSETRPQKALQAIDMLTEPVPIFNALTPTNTLLYLDKRGVLPVKLDNIDSIFSMLKKK